jgi:hypothetical protein
MPLHIGGRSLEPSGRRRDQKHVFRRQHPLGHHQGGKHRRDRHRSGGGFGPPRDRNARRGEQREHQHGAILMTARDDEQRSGGKIRGEPA